MGMPSLNQSAPHQNSVLHKHHIYWRQPYALR
jgi:hypothetical protein